MSDQGWRDFLAADGVGDWVVLHGGATAVFPVLSLGAAARLGDAIAQVPAIEGEGVLITVADDHVTVRLTRGMTQLERVALGYAGLADDNAVDPLGHGSTVWMQELDECKPLRHAMHVDISVAREHVDGRVAAD